MLQCQPQEARSCAALGAFLVTLQMDGASGFSVGKIKLEPGAENGELKWK